MNQKITIHADNQGETINKNIFGHFAEHLGRGIYEGIWVGEDSVIPNTDGIRNDVLQALQKLQIPVLRWPGGCFADEYHWKDGVGPREQRKRMVNTHWGGVVENNHFGTHEFFRLCELLGAEPYICGNVGSGTVQEMSEWVEYMTFDGESPMRNWREENGRSEPWKLTYFGVGNENWGCGGNMRPEYYADLYRRYQTYARNYGDNKLYKIAGGPNVDDYRWTEVLMKQAGELMDGLSLHYYTMPGDFWEGKGSAVDFSDSEWHLTLQRAFRMDELIRKHSTIMDQYDPEKRVGLIVDEWGTWFDPEPGTNPGFLYQQNTIRDALVAAVSLNIFIDHADRVQMANIAQTVNVLQAMILTDGADMLLTPTYHVFDFYQVHQDASKLDLHFDRELIGEQNVTYPQLSAAASRKGNVITLTVSNLDQSKTVQLESELHGFTSKSAEGKILAAPAANSHNSFEAPETVKPAPYTDFVLDETLKLNLPPMSVVNISITSDEGE